MKKVIVVSKTHLDLGFTDYAENIRQKYIKEFIPSAVELAQRVNTPQSKKFIWTTGSWILKEALEKSDEENKKRLVAAIERGDIVPHALPFTTHSELFDKETFDFGLSIVDEIDKIRGKKTVSAKMTDVPGHTKAIVPLLAKHGVKLLHIGVNGVSAVPEVPECFLWKCGDAEVVVVYSGSYGGPYKSELADEVLYLDHTLDNHGAPSAEKLKSRLAEIQREYPEYEVVAGTLDDFAEVMWQVRSRLPVLECEIGDSWIHGSAADPYKSASLRTLMRLKREWLADGSMERGSKEYADFSDALLCIGEHTCGMDVKIAFADYENYLKKDFNIARKKDKVAIRHLFRGFPSNFLTAVGRMFGSYKKGSYTAIEASWQEQREYIDKALFALSASHKNQAKSELEGLIPKKPLEIEKAIPYSGKIEFCGYEFELNENGGIGSLSYKGNEIIRKNNEAIIEYRSYSKEDYDFWFSHYARNVSVNAAWAYPDFGRPLLKYVQGKYPTGRFFYKMAQADICNEAECIKIDVRLKCEKRLCEELGAPREIQIVYTLNANGLKFSVLWFNKDASRLTEAVFLHLYPCPKGFELIKMGERINCLDTASMGGRGLHACEKCLFEAKSGVYSVESLCAPLISDGQGRILEYTNKNEGAENGVSFVLCDNAWGTNFPLWYEDNARFDFVITRED